MFIFVVAYGGVYSVESASGELQFFPNQLWGGGAAGNREGTATNTSPVNQPLTHTIQL